MSDDEKPVCVPSVLLPMIICFIFPPLFVLIHEYKKPVPFEKPNNANLVIETENNSPENIANKIIKGLNLK